MAAVAGEMTIRTATPKPIPSRTRNMPSNSAPVKSNPVRLRWDSGEDSLRVVNQDEFCQLQCLIDGPTAAPNHLLHEEGVRQNPTVILNFGRDEFELVRVGIIAKQLDLGQR